MSRHAQGLTQTVTVRMTPRLRYLAMIAARRLRVSEQEYIRHVLTTIHARELERIKDKRP